MENEDTKTTDTGAEETQDTGIDIGNAEIAFLESRPWRPQDADREMARQSIRNRVRNARVGDNVTFRPAKPKPTIYDSSDKRVAVYARVSTKSDEQVSSIENQTKYYTEKIRRTDNWTLQEIYSDEGKSGTSMKRRKQFKRMLQDAKAKKMDLIVCASVSRFARNVSDCIEQVRRLKTMNPSHPVGVYFETEDIYTLDPDSSQMLKIHALLADWESANKSRRMILSYDQRICTGQFPVADLLGYKHTKDGDLIIVEDQAVTVRFIFLAYIAGYTPEEIAEILTEKKRSTLRGRTVWNANMVKQIMLNERRWGDLEARKRIVIDYVEGTTIKNNNEREGAFVEGHHIGIVSREIAYAAHMLKASGRRHSDGVSDIGVIDSGALKGFISIDPCWAGVDNDMLQKVCRSVYTDDELHEIENEALILHNEEHCKTLSMALHEYHVPWGVTFLNQSMPSLLISPKGLKFNRVCHERLGDCRFIEVLYHPILQYIAVRACGANAINAIQWKKEDGKNYDTFSASAFAKAIYEKLDWIPELRFKFRAISRERDGEHILFISLDEPQIYNGRKEKTALPQPAVEYIPYKNSDIQNSGPFAREAAFSRFGTSIKLREHRDRLANTITASDIRVKGNVVENPLIGHIPTREEVAEELDQLLMSM